MLFSDAIALINKNLCVENANVFNLANQIRTVALLGTLHASFRCWFTVHYESYLLPDWHSEGYEADKALITQIS